MSKMDSPIGVLGTDRLPELPRFYFEAASRLLGASDIDLAPVALPLVNLQRHCLELVIKEIHLASSCLPAARLMAKGIWSTPDRPPENHHLSELVDALGESLSAHHLSMPTGLESLAREMDALSAPAPDARLPAPQRLPLREIQTRLESLVSTADIFKEDSLVFRLYAECATAINSSLDSSDPAFDPEIFT